MANVDFSKVITFFIVAIVGLSLVPAVADTIFANRNAFQISNETVDVTSAMSQGGEFDGTTPFQFTQDFVRQVDNVRWNTTDSLVLGTDVIITGLDLQNTTFVIANTSDTRNLYNAETVNTTTFNYTHGDNFVRSATSRTLLGLVILFFVLGVLLLAAKGVLRDRFDIF